MYEKPPVIVELVEPTDSGEYFVVETTNPVFKYGIVVVLKFATQETCKPDEGDAVTVDIGAFSFKSRILLVKNKLSSSWDCVIGTGVIIVSDCI